MNVCNLGMRHLHHKVKCFVKSLQAQKLLTVSILLSLKISFKLQSLKDKIIEIENMWLSSGCQELRRWEQERSVRGCKRASCGILWLEMICVFSTVSVSINIRTVIWGYSFTRCYHGGNWGQESWISLHWLIYISVF